MNFSLGRFVAISAFAALAAPSSAVAQSTPLPSPEASAISSPSPAPETPLPASPEASASPAPSPSPTPIPAGVVPSDVTIGLAGTVSPVFATNRIRTAIVRASQLQPGATVSVSGVTLPTDLKGGSSLEALAHVTITGGTFATVSGTTAIHLNVETLARLDPTILFYSDDPERVPGGDSVLYKTTLDPANPGRVYAYHVADTRGQKLYLSLRTRVAAARVQVLGYAAGPASGYGYVGHVSTLQYLLERSTQESFIADVDPGTPYFEQLGYRPLIVNDLVTAIYDLRVVDGGPVDVEVVAVSDTGDPASLLDATELAGDGHRRRGEFSLLGVPPLALTYAAGDPDPSPAPIGDESIANLRPGGRALGGDYGVLRDVVLHLSNPTATQQTIYLYEQPISTYVTTTMWFSGDQTPTEIPCVHIATNRYTVKSFALDPGATVAATAEYMTDGASSYPILFGLTAQAPSPPPGPYSPDACNPHTPPPSPQPQAPTSPPLTTPAPSASPSPASTT